jgi:hypothetical protein
MTTMRHVFSTILLATEHTEFDTGAERLAPALAALCAARLLIVVPLLSNPEYEAQAPQLAARAEADTAARLAQLGAMMSAAGVQAELHARRGPEPYREIVDEASERHADLVVIRRRGRRGLLANLLVGEMVRNVVAHATCSVLVTPRSAVPWSQRVMVAIDPQAADMTPVATAAAIAFEYGLPVTVVVVIEAGGSDASQRADAALQRVSSTASALGVAVERLVRTGKPHQQIVAAARETGADLVVIGRHRDDTLARAWLGGVAQKVIGLADLPVLVCINPFAPEPSPP